MEGSAVLPPLGCISAGADCPEPCLSDLPSLPMSSRADMFQRKLMLGMLAVTAHVSMVCQPRQRIALHQADILDGAERGKGQPPRGFEPRTDGLRNHCSTAELRRRANAGLFYGSNAGSGSSWRRRSRVPWRRPSVA